MKRRQFLYFSIFAMIPIPMFAKRILLVASEVGGNFKHIYSSIRLKADFRHFLENVFNLYPVDKFHQLISNKVEQNSSDRDIYISTQSNLNSISPFFSTFNYELPALFKQKEIMAKQTIDLLGENSKFHGYLEIGSSGRYLDYLEEAVDISGERYYADGKEPGYAISEMVDRGQINIGATYIPLADYKTRYSSIIPEKSLDLVTIYIGFHHCPIHLRKSFISSIRDTLRIGGKLILRDHDCNTEDQKTMVALAHDVFNMGTHETWKYNNDEVRNFYSLEFIINFVEKIGFNFEGKTLFQKGDPTKNALMLFTKIELKNI